MNRKSYYDLIVYQIYPRSFYDANGDGIGDINGIIQKLDYLKDLGVNAVWLCPCYKSPNCDNGYDISDYRDIAEEFGTLEEWKKMVAEMHARGIKLIMDFVGNHTSSEHKWFKEARRSKDNYYHDYYIWRDSIPNDWQSEFGGTAWEFNPKTNEYYLHSFAIAQPDLNWENENVRREMQNIIDYWVDLGVDGFRCDVLDYISKDFALDKIKKGPRLHEYVRELFGREKVKHIFTVGECSADESEISEICGEDRNELSCVFQFEHFSVGRKGRFVKLPFDYDEIKSILTKWQYFTQSNNLIYTLFTDNHDQPHYISRLGNDGENRYECATMYAAMFYLLKGVPFIYQGQEFGTPDPHYDNIDDYNDIETINYYKANADGINKSQLMAMVNFGSRDNARRPICWGSGKNYGFGEAPDVWLKLHSHGSEINLEKDKNAEKSVFCFYKKLIAFRKRSNAIRYGSFEDLTKSKGYFAYMREAANEKILIVCNFENVKEISGLPNAEFLFGNLGKLRTANGKYLPFETAVFQLRN
mgnify:CR=1 FL=1